MVSNSIYLARRNHWRTILHVLPLHYAEQYCNTSVRGMLNLFLQTSVGLSPEDARSKVHLVGAMIYLSPLIGGIIADLLVGSFYAACMFGAILLGGMTSLAAVSYERYPINMYMAVLGCISLGLGALKPCLTALASHQIELDLLPAPFEWANVDYFRSAFVVSNAGILSASTLTPLLATVACYHGSCYPLAFGVAALLLALAALAFLAGWYRFIKMYTARSINSSNQKWSELFHDQRVREDLVRLLRFFAMCLPLSFFWMLYDQATTAWQMQYETMDHGWLGFHVHTELMANAGSIFLLAMIPILTYIIDPLLLRVGFRLHGVPRMGVAFLVLIASFGVSMAVQTQSFGVGVVENGRVVGCVDCLSGAWQLPQWFLHALAEALLGTATPEFAHCQGGERFRTLGPGLLYLTNAFGNLLVFVLDRYFFDDMDYIPRMGYYLGVAAFANLVLMSMYAVWFSPILESEAQVRQLNSGSRTFFTQANNEKEVTETIPETFGQAYATLSHSS
ncbi:hypothetical protein DSO57_1011821 [Entomophthora muscae]|uniref:Uncharacterized protein n=1 Tax=Entomophthora muscae TaxID=34485 RepID=A0ACC2UFJ7_9FUNG|nr:hypothetical protein DSO57_1011821 [Entomophthora muscae]